MTAAATNSPSRLQNAATKLKTRSDYSASPSKLAGSKQLFKNNDYLGGGGGWESTQPTVPTDYSSPSRLLRARKGLFFFMVHNYVFKTFLKNLNLGIWNYHFIFIVCCNQKNVSLILLRF